MSESIIGINSLLKRIGEAQRVLPDIAERSCLKGVMVIEGEAKTNAPVKYGHLRNSIKSKKVTLGAEVGPTAEYALYQEYGTGKYAENGKGRKTPWAYEDPKTGEVIWTAGNKPSPFMRPALESKKDEAGRVSGDAIIKELTKLVEQRRR